VTVAVATFVVTLALIMGAYWGLVVRPEQQGREQVWKRLRTTTPRAVVTSTLLKRAEQLSAVPSFDVFLTRSRKHLGPVELLIEQSGVRMTVGTFMAASVLCALVAVTLVQWLVGGVMLAGAAALVASQVPAAVLRRMRTTRVQKFEAQFPEALALMSRALRAGHAFTTGLAMVAEEMPKPIGPEFRTLYEHQNFGMPIPDALHAFAKRVPLLDAKFLVTAVLIQRESGGNLSEILDNIATVIRDRFRVKRQIQVVSAHARISGFVLIGTPPALAMAVFTLNPDHFRLLTEDPLGTQLIMAAVGLQAMGTLIIRRLIKIEY
jgi:tight adherence protein B